MVLKSNPQCNTLEWDFKSYSVKMSYAIIHWECLRIPEWCIVEYSVLLINIQRGWSCPKLYLDCYFSTSWEPGNSSKHSKHSFMVLYRFWMNNRLENACAFSIEWPLWPVKIREAPLKVDIGAKTNCFVTSIILITKSVRNKPNSMCSENKSGGSR